MPKFVKGDPRTREAGRTGGLVKAVRTRKEQKPFAGTIIDMMDSAGLTGSDWWPWRVFLKAVFGLPMDADELEFYQRQTDRETPPPGRVKEAWMPVGRRGGKSRIAAIVALYVGASFDTSQRAAGEMVVVPVLAADKRQARAVFGYLKGFCDLEPFKPYVHRVLKEIVELRIGVNLEVHAASHRTTRGYSTPGVICDEVAFWHTDEAGANPDSEILAALRPSAATVPDGIILGLSSPYAAKGELFKAHERYFGQDDPHVLVWNADTRTMNPTIPARIIDRAFEEDPIAAASEYGSEGRVQFRRDVETFLDPDAVANVTMQGQRELPPRRNVQYFAFVDPSGGSQDSFTCAVAHMESGNAVLDAIREVRPPFSPDSVVQEFAAFLVSYGVREVRGDRYAGEWPRERFQVHGIRYMPAEHTKSDLYRELVAPLNSGRVLLLDHPVLRAQLLGLERRVSRGGRDTVDHAPGGRDDVANAAAGALNMVTAGASRKLQTFEWKIV